MRRTTTRSVDFKSLAMRGDGAALEIALMIACNDLSLANEAAGTWKREQPRYAKDRQVGARLYFIKLQVAHLHEALKVIGKIVADDELMKFIQKCDSQTRSSFGKLREFLPGGSNSVRFDQITAQLRSNLAFHYSGAEKLIMRALQDRGSRPEARTSSITRGNTAFLWHFSAGDHIYDSIVVRQIMKIPRTADVRQEADRIADELHAIFLTLMDFSGEFIWRYCGRRG